MPAATGMRGTIFGAIGARLGTADAAGLLTIDLRPGGVLRRNVVVAVLTTFSSALWLASWRVSISAIAGQPSIPLSELLIVAMVGGAIGSVIILLITVALAAASTRLGWDLDSVSTPMVTALGDMTSFPGLFLATLLLGHGSVTSDDRRWSASSSALVCIVAGYRTRDRLLRKILWEMTATIMLTPILDVFAGAAAAGGSAELVQPCPC